MKLVSWKRLIKSRTLQFSLALCVFGAIEATDSLLQPIIGERFFGIFCMIISVIVAILRFVTTQSLTDTANTD